MPQIKYAPGMRVIIRGEEWRIIKVEKNDMGNQALYCRGISTIVKDKDSIFLDDLDKVELVDPTQVRFVCDDSNSFLKSRLYIESQLRQKIPTDHALQIGHGAVMDVMPYQLEPAQMALKKARQRILIADSVGLGKTLEAGILMSELIARGKGKRILVVTVKSMMAQFQKEMWDRFTIPLVRLDSTRIHRIRASLPVNYNPFFYYDKTIVSIDTLKRDVEYRVHLENAYWDIIVIDEAQNVADRQNQAQRAKLAKLLAERSDTMILLSATPHDGKPRSFASLMNMLDPTAIADPDHYKPEDIQGLFIRRFKKDVKDQVKGSFLEREVFIEKAEASEVEEEAFSYFSSMDLQMDSTRRSGSGQLFKTGLLKTLLSSPVACQKSIDARISKLKKISHSEADAETLLSLKRYLGEIDAAHFAKYQHLLHLLQSESYGWDRHAKDDRIVIFTERIETMKYVAASLRGDLMMTDEEIVEMAGTLSDDELQKIVDDFGRHEAPIRILVASDVASEGLNLHYLCHRLIHFDIPWSLIVFQQRNGRIDRYGQSKRPDIRYFMTESRNPEISDDNHILELLTEKENSVHDNIGDPVSILGKGTVEAEEETIGGILEKGADCRDLEKAFRNSEDDFDILDLFLHQAQTKKEEVEKVDAPSLFSDKDYLLKSMQLLGKRVEEARGYSGLRLEMDSNLRSKLKKLIPEEALPEANWLRLSDDKAFCAEDSKRSLQNDMDKSSWAEVQYLWPIHPLMHLVHDKVGQLYKRKEAPILRTERLQKGHWLFLLEGSTPNRKSTPVLDEWFGLLFEGNDFVRVCSLEEVFSMTGLMGSPMINRGDLTDEEAETAAAMLPNVIQQARTYMNQKYHEYQLSMGPQMEEEINKLIRLQAQKQEYISEKLSTRQKLLDIETRKTDELFDRFTKWVHETLEIENNPYIRVIAVLKGEA